VVSPLQVTPSECAYSPLGATRNHNLCASMCLIRGVAYAVYARTPADQTFRGMVASSMWHHLCRSRLLSVHTLHLGSHSDVIDTWRTIAHTRTTPADCRLGEFTERSYWRISSASRLVLSQLRCCRSSHCGHCSILMRHRLCRRRLNC